MLQVKYSNKKGTKLELIFEPNPNQNPWLGFIRVAIMTAARTVMFLNVLG